MSPADKTLTCAECGAEFVFTASEQEFFASRGYVNEPKRCPTCREARRSQRFGSRGGSSVGGREREMYPATCASCGAQTQVPFEPRQGRPVYCSDCFSRMRSVAPR
ncbi:MAG: zinc-ribbon domain containing protein [Chloroflexi bacterium]|nr:zinc-ribbon domain containing protein [Chloroflexota bacterium]